MSIRPPPVPVAIVEPRRYSQFRLHSASAFDLTVAKCNGDGKVKGPHAWQFCRAVWRAAFPVGAEVAFMPSMNVYKSIGYTVGTPEALALAARLSAWHDAMVAHQRPSDTARVIRCDDDCPHAEASSLWHEAVEVFGDCARQMVFLRRHASSTHQLPLYARAM